MSRKKSLEKEFEEYKAQHKYNIIASALIRFHDEGIYESVPILNPYKEIDEPPTKKAFITLDELIDARNKGDEKEYNDIYEMCWRKISPLINDNKSYYLDAKPMDTYGNILDENGNVIEYSEEYKEKFKEQFKGE